MTRLQVSDYFEMSMNLLMISRAWSFTYPPSTSPGVSMIFNVNPALVRDTITGLGASDCKSKVHQPDSDIVIQPLQCPLFCIEYNKKYLESTGSDYSLPDNGVHS